MGDGANIALQELAARRQVEAFERVGEKLEIRILNCRRGGTGAPGLGMLGSYLTSAYSPRGVGRERILNRRRSKWRSIRAARCRTTLSRFTARRILSSML